MSNWDTKWLLDKPILAIDFDGTLVDEESTANEWDNPNDVKISDYVKTEIFNELVAVRNDCYFILWTCREGELLKKAIKFCSVNGLTFDKINENYQQLFPTGPKVYADYYIDDRSVLPVDFWLIAQKGLK